jgi:hypothetical protein
MLTVIELPNPPTDFLSGEPEGAQYYLAYQQSGIEAFRFGYLEVRRNQRRVAVLPYFLTDLDLGIMLESSLLKSVLGRIRIPIACVGHPAVELSSIEGETSSEVLAAANRVLAQKASLVAYKGFGGDLPLSGFIRVKHLPMPLARISSDYYERLSSRRRNDLKRKLKKGKGLRFEEHDGLPPHLVGRVFQLYSETLERASLVFDRLTEEYFHKTSAISKYLLAFHEDKLVGFAQLMVKNGRLAHKYVGMDYGVARDCALYFLLMLKAVDLCIRDGIGEINFGGTSYCFKRLLGCELHDTWIWYRHSHPVVHWLLGKLGFLLEPSEKDLR